MRAARIIAAITIGAGLVNLTSTLASHLPVQVEEQTNTTHRSQSTWHQEDLFKTCRNVFEASTRICDPEHLLDVPSHYSTDDDDADDTVDNSNSTALHAITIALQELKTNHHLPVSTYNSCQNKNGLSKGKPVSMAIVIVSSIFEFRNERDDEIASLLNYAWDARHNQECQHNDILLFISLEDGIIHFHTSEEIKKILTRSTISSITDRMRTPLNHQRYAISIIVAIEDIIRSIDEERFSTDTQTSNSFAKFLCVLLAVSLASTTVLRDDKDDTSRRKENRENSVSNYHSREYSSSTCTMMEDAYDIAEQGPTENGQVMTHCSLLEQYGCTSCTICHSDYEEDFPKTLMSKGKGIEVLPCGHPFHSECIETWRRTGRTGSNLCPICKVQIGEIETPLLSSPDDSTLTDISHTSLSSFERALERHEERRRRRRHQRRTRNNRNRSEYEELYDHDHPGIPSEGTPLMHHDQSQRFNRYVSRYDNDDSPQVTRLPLSPLAPITLPGEIWTTDHESPHPLRATSRDPLYDEEHTNAYRYQSRRRSNPSLSPIRPRRLLPSLPHMPSSNDHQTRYQTPQRRPLPFPPRAPLRPPSQALLASAGFSPEQFHLMHRAELIQERRRSIDETEDVV